MARLSLLLLAAMGIGGSSVSLRKGGPPKDVRERLESEGEHEGREKEGEKRAPPDLGGVDLGAGGKLTSFETGCYVKNNPVLEEGGANGKSYRGLVTSTHSGRVCQNWLSNHPHKIPKKISSVADEEIKVDEEDPDAGVKMKWGTGIGNHNYCRNPDKSKTKPWCYTMDPNEEHAIEECDIPQCDSPLYVDWKTNATDLAKEIEASPDCACAPQLFGSTKTTKDTAVPLSELSTVKDVHDRKTKMTLSMQRQWWEIRAGRPHRRSNKPCNCNKAAKINQIHKSLR